TTTHRNVCSLVTAVKRWKRYFSTSHAGGGRTRPRNEQRQRYRHGVFVQPRRRHGATLLVPSALVVAAHPRPYLLAGRADADVGISAGLYFAERRLLRAGGRRVHRLGAVVGYSVSRPARFFHFVPRGNVRAQPRQHHDVALASGGIPARAHDHEHGAAVDRDDSR